MLAGLFFTVCIVKTIRRLGSLSLMARVNALLVVFFIIAIG